MTLDEIAARANAAQCAWEEFQQGIATTRFALEESNNSAEDVPRLVGALRAVEALHADDGRGICVHCTHINGYQMQSHPCPTITAIREALGA